MRQHFHNFAIWKISHAFAIMCGFLISFHFFISFHLRCGLAAFDPSEKPQLVTTTRYIIFFAFCCYCCCAFPPVCLQLFCCTFMRSHISKAINFAALRCNKKQRKIQKKERVEIVEENFAHLRDFDFFYQRRQAKIN